MIVALMLSPFAIAQSSLNGKNILGGKRSPGSNQSQAFTAETEIIANTSTYGTRQSNKSNNGGGAVYGCRSRQGGTEKGNEPCLRGSNLTDGRAFEFNTGNGPEVGRITAGNVNAAPFTTNATGVATGLNADKVDGKDAEQISAETLEAAKKEIAAAGTKWLAEAEQAVDGSHLFAKVAANGGLGAENGVETAGPVAGQAGTYRVVFDGDVGGCTLTATQQTITDAGSAAVELQADKRTVLVRTRAGGGADGAGTTEPAERPFHLVATC